MAGLELLFNCVSNSLTCSQDALICLVHWEIVKSGYKCLGVGDEVSQWWLWLFIRDNLLPNVEGMCVYWKKKKTLSLKTVWWSLHYTNYQANKHLHCNKCFTGLFCCKVSQTFALLEILYFPHSLKMKRRSPNCFPLAGMKARICMHSDTDPMMTSQTYCSKPSQWIQPSSSI